MMLDAWTRNRLLVHCVLCEVKQEKSATASDGIIEKAAVSDNYQPRLRVNGVSMLMCGVIMSHRFGCRILCVIACESGKDGFAET